MTLFPNPVNDNFTISLAELPKGFYEIALFDMYGRKVTIIYNGNLVYGDHQFHLSAVEINLKQGIYLLSLKGEGLDLSQKLIVR